MGAAKEQCSARVSIQATGLLARSLVHLAAVSSHPLFSVATTSGLLVLLYVPRLLLPLLFSPALLATLLLLAALLRSGSAPPEACREPPSKAPAREPEPEKNQKPPFCGDFLEWGRRGGPLEVIYEEYEREEGGGESPEYSVWPEYSLAGVRGSGATGFCYTDSDTDSDEEYPKVEGWDSPENLCFRWEKEEEGEGEGMIEIALEEENLIEIDIFGCR